MNIINYLHLDLQKVIYPQSELLETFQKDFSEVPLPLKYFVPFSLGFLITTIYRYIENLFDYNNNRNYLLKAIKRERNGEVQNIINSMLDSESRKSFFLEDDLFLNMACICNNLEAIKFLIDKGVKISSTNERAMLLPLHCAVMDKEKFNKECLEYLLSLEKVEINAKNKHGATPLHVACNVSNLEAIKALIANDADLNAKDINGDTLLHYAVGNSNKECLEYLLSLEGIEIDAKNKSGHTPLHFAYHLNHSEATALLKEKSSIKIETNEIPPIPFRRILGYVWGGICEDVSSTSKIVSLFFRSLVPDYVPALNRIDRFRN